MCKGMERQMREYSVNLLLAVLFVVFSCEGTLSAAEFTVQSKAWDVVYRAVGSLRPRLDAKVQAQASGRLTKVLVREGDEVVLGDVLAHVEDRELTLRLSQARQGVQEAEAHLMQARHGKVAALAVLAQARAEFERTKKFLSQKAATKQQMEQVESAFKQAEASVSGADEAIRAAQAGVTRANKSVEEVEVALDYTKVTAPFSGTVLERMVEPGELAWQGRPLFRLSDPKTMQLEAHVREGLVGTLAKGQNLDVRVDAIDADLVGTVSEIVPSADPKSRTFTVKIALPSSSKLRSGMFARTAIPAGSRQVVVVSEAAIRQMGQLTMVSVKGKGGWIQRMVRVGRARDGLVEVLSGLSPCEIVSLVEGGRR